MLAHLSELVHLIVRWVHLIAGIMWIGNSMLFNWIDRNLEKPADAKKGMVGEIWMVHSGGFYSMEKKFLEPGEMPKNLHWFKWQNGITWLSGISLLILLYFMSAKSMMLDPDVSNISGQAAVGISVGTLLVAFVAYDFMWRSAIGRMPALATWLSIAVVLGGSAVFFHFFSGRAAYIHVGVLLGTLMTGNVWFVILPSQHELIAATKEGREQSEKIGYQAKQRSIHNNYMTFPLLFIMLSGHFPSTFSHPQSWLVLLVLAIGSAGIRYFMNVRFTAPLWLFPAGSLFIITAGIVWVLIADPKGDMFKNNDKVGRKVEFAEVADIVHKRCTPCHSQTPTNELYKTAPNGVTYDTPQQIKQMAPKIKERAVTLKNMPLANMTQITEPEREALGLWIDQGAEIPQ
jgi:uncharacterized membrane protein